MKHLLMIAALLTASPAIGEEFTVLDAQHSNLSFTSRQMGVPVEGSFKKFTLRIAVNPARPEAGSARIDIDLTSIDAGSTEADEEVAGKAWFDSKRYPTASFVSSGISRLGNGRFEVTGKMTIKGKTLDIKAPFLLKQQANALIIEGMFPLKRLDYGIGSGIWADTSVVNDEVQIRFHFTVAKNNHTERKTP